MDICLSKLKRIIKEQSEYDMNFTPGKLHIEYQKSYFSTNEYIKSYLDIYDLSSSSNVLSITSSGDQIFNLLTKGILNVDAFDTNQISEYIAFGIKKAMILKYNYEEYLKLNTIIINNDELTKEFSREIMIGLLPFMDEKYKKFWQEIIDYEYMIQKENNSNIDFFRLVSFSFKDNEFLMQANNYMNNKDNYNKLKHNLGKANISFTCTNAIFLYENFKSKTYDLILLSNVLDYFYKYYNLPWTYNDLRNYIQNLEKIMNFEGVIFINYIFNMMSFIKNDNDLTDLDKLTENSNNCRIIGNSLIRLNDLLDEEIFILKSNGERTSDGILLKRVKK